MSVQTDRPAAVSAQITARRPEGARSIDEILEDARDRLDRIDPHEAFQRQTAGALIVDIRPSHQRVVEKVIPGSVPIERNHLEWRLDPGSDARLPIAAFDLDVIVVCAEGYTSSLAASALQELGIARATDLIGGVAAWGAAGLSVVDDVANQPVVDPLTTVSPLS